MGYRNRTVGSRSGGGGVQSGAWENVDRRERLRRMALETIDLSKDPYFMKNHLGKIECRLCLTMHNNEGNYLAHTQGKRHKLNLARRMAKERKDGSVGMLSQPLDEKKTLAQRTTIKIGKPGYTITKLRDSETKQKGIFFQIMYPEVSKDVKPMHRFMSAYEQQVDIPIDNNYQYLVVAADPYNNVGFKIPNLKIETVDADWDKDNFVYNINLQFDKDAKLPTEKKPAPPKDRQPPPPPVVF